MKKNIFLMAIMALLAGAAGAQVHVRPHITKDGAFVQGYERTAPNNTKMDNYSNQGNTNPYTGQQGTVNPYAPSQQPGYKPPQSNYGQQQCGTLPNGQYVCR